MSSCRSSAGRQQCRSGDCTPDRNDPPPPNICLSSQTPGTLPPAKYPSTLPNSSTPPLPNPSHFPRSSNALAWMDHSGRGYNPRPAQSRNAPPLPNVCLQFQIRKARMLLVECRLGSTGRGVPVGNNAGRGLNPRPERSTPAKYLLKLSNDRNAPPRQVSTCNSEFVNPSLAQPFPFPSLLQCSCVGGSFRSGMQSPTGAGIRQPLPCPTLPISLAPPMLLRGWIIPVGGSTPDRHKADRHRGALN